MRKLAEVGLSVDRSKAFDIGVYSKKKDEGNYGLAAVSGLGTGVALGATTGATSQLVTGRSPLRTLKSLVTGNPGNFIRKDHLRAINFGQAGKAFARNSSKGIPAQTGAFLNKINWEKVRKSTGRGALVGSLGATAGVVGLNTLKYNAGKAVTNKEKSIEKDNNLNKTASQTAQELFKNKPGTRLEGRKNPQLFNNMKISSRDLAFLIHERKKSMQKQASTGHEMIWYEKRSTPEVIPVGTKPKAKPSYGPITKRRKATADEEKEIATGKWIRIDERGNRPSSDSYKKTKYRPQLVKEKTAFLWGKEKKSNPKPQLEYRAPTVEEFIESRNFLNSKSDPKHFKGMKVTRATGDGHQYYLEDKGGKVYRYSNDIDVKPKRWKDPDYIKHSDPIEWGFKKQASAEDAAIIGGGALSTIGAKGYYDTRSVNKDIESWSKNVGNAVKSAKGADQIDNVFDAYIKGGQDITNKRFLGVKRGKFLNKVVELANKGKLPFFRDDASLAGDADHYKKYLSLNSKELKNYTTQKGIKNHFKGEFTADAKKITDTPDLSIAQKINKLKKGGMGDAASEFGKATGKYGGEMLDIPGKYNRTLSPHLKKIKGGMIGLGLTGAGIAGAGIISKTKSK